MKTDQKSQAELIEQQLSEARARRFAPYALAALLRGTARRHAARLRKKEASGREVP